MQTKRVVRIVVALVVLAMVALACTSTPSSEPQLTPAGGAQPGSPAAAPTGTVRVAASAFAAETTAKWMDTASAVQYIGPIYDPPIRPAKDGSLTRDGIISDWQFDVSGTTLTLTVRPGVRFHNGTEVTAEDIAFTLETFARPGLLNTSGNVLRSAIKATNVKDRSTLVVTLSVPNALLINAFSWLAGDVAVISKDYFNNLPGSTFEEKTAAFVKKPIGTGPWKFVSREIGVSITFEANVDYYDKARVPKFKNLELLLVPEVSTAENMLRTGQVDVAWLTPDQTVAMVKAGYRAYMVKNVVHAGITFVKSYDPAFITSDVRVREALTVAVDRAAITRSIFPEIPGTGPTGELIRGPWTSGPGIAGWRDDMPSYPYDPQRARQLLQQVGYYDNPKTIVVWSWPGQQVRGQPQILEAVAGFWKAVGVKVEIRPTEIASFNNKLRQTPQPFSENDVAMFAAGWRGGSTGLENLRVFGASRALGVLNVGPMPTQVDNYYRTISQITDPKKFDTAMAEVWRTMYDAYWAIPIAWVHMPVLVDPKVVGGYTPIEQATSYSPWETLIPVSGAQK